MDIKDIKIGMKVELLGKHGCGDYNNIEDWFEDNYLYNQDSIDVLKSQGFGYVIRIDHGEIWVDECENGTGWAFLPCDLEPYEETIEYTTQYKTPKEWLLTPSVICTTRNGRKFVVVSNDINVTLDNFNTWSNDLNLTYDEKLIKVNDCPPSDIMKITYGKETVYERKEEEVKEMTIDEIEKIVGSKIKIVNNK